MSGVQGDSHAALHCGGDNKLNEVYDKETGCRERCWTRLRPPRL